MRKVLFVLIPTLALLLASAVPAPAAEVDLAKAKATFEATCGKCHPLDRPLGVTGRDAAGWTETVKRMSGNHQGRFGTPIAAEDQAAIVEYLVRRK